MKLSQAILKGCEQHSQYFGAIFYPFRSNIESTCVMGAAVVGVFGNITATPWDDLENEYPILRQPTKCPINNTFCTMYKYTVAPTSLSNVLVHLNDDHHMSREDIAAWLETQDL